MALVLVDDTGLDLSKLAEDRGSVSEYVTNRQCANVQLGVAVRKGWVILNPFLCGRLFFRTKITTSDRRSLAVLKGAGVQVILLQQLIILLLRMSNTAWHT